MRVMKVTFIAEKKYITHLRGLCIFFCNVATLVFRMNYQRKHFIAEITRLNFANFTARAKKRVSELERMLEIAKKNYTQLGGRLAEDKKRMQQIRDKDK